MQIYGQSIEIFLDTGSLEEIEQSSGNSLINGITTNPCLVRKAGHTDYRSFVNRAIEVSSVIPLSVGVLSDSENEIFREALELQKISPRVYVKIPVVSCSSDSRSKLIKELIQSGVQLNLTAVLEDSFIMPLIPLLDSETSHFISVFAGRIADTGRDPKSLILRLNEQIKDKINIGIIWASTREAYNIVEAAQAGAAAITMPKEILNKSSLFGKDLRDFTVETVKMFNADAKYLNF